jgi:hypothetical protein
MLRADYEASGPAFSTYGEDRMLATDRADLVQFGEIQLGSPPEHQNMRVLDWEKQSWSDPEDMTQEFRVKNTTVTVSLTGDTYFDEEWYDGGPYIGTDFGSNYTLNFVMDFAESSHAMTALLEFSRQVTDVEFSLLDIDLGPLTEEHPGFVDQVTIVGFLGEIPVLPSISSGSLNEVDGNVITGTFMQQTSTSYNLIHFDQPIDRISLLYGSGADAPIHPGRQGIGINDLHFTINNPEPGSIALAIIGCGVLAGRRYWKSRAARS